MPSLSANELRAVHDMALPYEDYLLTHASKAEPWRVVEKQLSLTNRQRELLASFKRRMPVIVLSGIWCGDCSSQGPMLHLLASASSVIDLRFVERDDVMDLAERVKINDGLRVPTVITTAEDFELVSIFGDRTLSRYRAVAARKLGAACPLPGAPQPDDAIEATVQDWLDRFEHDQLLLRLSGRLRQLHGD